ncbi:MAG: hypothetical protein A2047_01925 [Omnitrophica bacterium GWA2_41_15]|nr:MAG: hypothetical protein A2047_01925 [Omnitrophica bacterium GWA2_41_15]
MKGSKKYYFVSYAVGLLIRDILISIDKPTKLSEIREKIKQDLKNQGISPEAVGKNPRPSIIFYKEITKKEYETEELFG